MLTSARKKICKKVFLVGSKENFSNNFYFVLVQNKKKLMENVLSKNSENYLRAHFFFLLNTYSSKKPYTE